MGSRISVKFGECLNKMDTLVPSHQQTNKCDLQEFAEKCELALTWTEAVVKNLFFV